jgi:PilZ domain
MHEPKAERRSRKRLPVRVPVEIRAPNALADQAYTRDLSKSGIFLYSKGDIAAGTHLELILMLPPELTNGEKQWVCCQAAVVRVEHDGAGGARGIAAELTNMVALPELG